MENNTTPLNEIDVTGFIRLIDFTIPLGFIELFKSRKGALINTNDHYAIIWSLTDMIRLNKDYNVGEYAPEFFVIGSNGGNIAYAIEKSTGSIFELPFIGMSKEEAIFRNKTFEDFVQSL